MLNGLVRLGKITLSFVSKSRSNKTPPALLKYVGSVAR